MKEALSVSGLYKTYPKKGTRVTAVNNVSFRVEQGGIVGLLGTNGAGKTTTIKCALGLIEPDKGEIRVGGVDMCKERNKALRKVGAVLEGNRNLFWRYSALENLMFFANLAGIPTRVARKRGQELLEVFGLANRMNSQVSEFSRGMQQKVAICAALIRNPEVLMLDEPTLGLDVATTAHLHDLLVRLVKEEGRTIIITSHQMELIQQLCERVVIMQKGQVLVDDRVEQLLDYFATRCYRFRTERPLSPAGSIRIRNAFQGAEIADDGQSSTVVISFTKGEHLYEAMQMFHDDGVLLRSIEHQTPDLSQVFLQLTREEASGL